MTRGLLEKTAFSESRQEKAFEREELPYQGKKLRKERTSLGTSLYREQTRINQTGKPEKIVCEQKIEDTTSQ